MIRKIQLLLLLTSLLMTFCPLSKGHAKCCLPFEGLYLGIGGGIATNLAYVESLSSVSFLADSSENSLTIVSTPRICQLKPWGEVYVGYGYSFACIPWLYLGGRLGLNVSSWDLKHKSHVTHIAPAPGNFSATLDTTVTARLKTAELTLDFKTGFVFSDVLLFAFVGGTLNNCELDLRSEFPFEDLTSNETFFNTLKLHNEKSSYGLRVGAGIEKKLTPCLGLNISYIYTLYHRPNVRGFADVVTDEGVVPNGLGGKHSAKTRRQVVSLGLAYYF